MKTIRIWIATALLLSSGSSFAFNPFTGMCDWYDSIGICGSNLRWTSSISDFDTRIWTWRDGPSTYALKLLGGNQVSITFIPPPGGGAVTVTDYNASLVSGEGALGNAEMIISIPVPGNTFGVKISAEKIGFSTTYETCVSSITIPLNCQSETI